MTSIKTQLPYEYYSLPFCRPADDNLHYKTLNLGKQITLPATLCSVFVFVCTSCYSVYCVASVFCYQLILLLGEVLRGDRIVNTPYVVSSQY